MIFLAGVAFVAFRFGKGPAVIACILAMMAFDFFFVPPYHTFVVSDTQYLVTFGVMLAIGLLISTLASRLKAQVTNTRNRERRTAPLYELGRQLSSISGRVFLVSAACAKIAEMVHGEVAIYVLGSSGQAEIIHGQDGIIGKHRVSLPAAQWVIDHGQLAIAGASSTLLSTSSLDEPTRRQLLESVSTEALRLNRLLENILQMSRLDAGATVLNIQWHVLEEAKSANPYPSM